MQFDPTKDFSPIVLLGTSTIVLEVNPEVPVQNVQEFIEYAKENPGLIYGAAGTGTSMHLAVAGSERNPQLPDVPTIAEAGVEGYAFDPWFAVYGPAGIDEEIVEKLNSAFSKALNSEEVQEILQNAGFTPKSSSVQELDELSKSEYERWGQIMEEAQLTM